MFIRKLNKWNGKLYHLYLEIGERVENSMHFAINQHILNFEMLNKEYLF